MATAGSDTVAGYSPISALPLRQEVIRRLRTAILSFKYRPGDRLIERDLGEQLGVSRTVIREALCLLEAEGLITIVPNRGPVITSLTYDEAKALYEVREPLEATAAMLCAERASAAQRASLVKTLRRVETAYRGSDLAAQFQAKGDFYEALCDGAGNKVIAKTLRMLRAQTYMLHGPSLQLAGRRSTSLDELRRLSAAIDSGDREAARMIAADHVRNAGAAALAAWDHTE